MSPATALRVSLAAARRRGVPFDEAWPRALAGALVIAPSDERAEWTDVLSGLCGAFRAGWEREAPGRALAALLAVAEDPERVPMPERVCEHCGEEIDPERDRRARYCSDRCRRDAYEARQAEGEPVAA